MQLTLVKQHMRLASTGDDVYWLFCMHLHDSHVHGLRCCNFHKAMQRLVLATFPVSKVSFDTPYSSLPYLGDGWVRG